MVLNIPFKQNIVNVLEIWLLLTLISPGYFGGWVAWGGGLLQISAVDHAIATKICIKVECDVNYKTVLLDYSLLLSFILYELIMLIYAKNLIFTINH